MRRVTVRTSDHHLVYMTAADLLAREMKPRPLYSERRRMDRYTPNQLAAYLILRSVYFGLPAWVARQRVIRYLWRTL